jgi:hypothetical protein
MPYLQRLNTAQGLTAQDAIQLTAELDTLRAELNDIRTKYAALQAALNAGTAPGAGGYPNATMALAAAQFTRT